MNHRRAIRASTSVIDWMQVELQAKKFSLSTFNQLVILVNIIYTNKLHLPALVCMDEEVAAYKGLDPKDQKYLLVQALPPSTRTFGPQRLGQGPKPDLQRKTH